MRRKGPRIKRGPHTKPFFSERRSPVAVEDSQELCPSVKNRWMLPIPPGGCHRFHRFRPPKLCYPEFFFASYSRVSLVTSRWCLTAEGTTTMRVIANEIQNKTSVQISSARFTYKTRPLLCHSICSGLVRVSGDSEIKCQSRTKVGNQNKKMHIRKTLRCFENFEFIGRGCLSQPATVLIAEQTTCRKSKRWMLPIPTCHRFRSYGLI
jgi:hypothetical protein